MRTMDRTLILASRAFAVATCLWLTSWPAGGLRADTVVRSTGGRYDDVEIMQARYDEVLLERGGQTMRLSGDQVESIDRSSAVLRRANELRDRGQFEEASAEYARTKVGKDWEKAEASYRAGECLLLAGKAREAAAAFKSYLDEHRESKDWWVPHAVYGLGQASLELGSSKTAVTYLDELTSYGKSWELRATMGKAKALRLQKKYVEARKLFNQVINNRQASGRLVQEAMVGYGRTQLAQEQYGALIQKLDEWFFGRSRTRDVDFGPARGEATLLMGRAYQGQGGKENLEQAEIWLLKAAVLHGSDGRVLREASQELAKLYDDMGQKDRAAQWRSRSGG